MNTKRITGVLQVLSLFFLIDLATPAQAATYSFKSFDPPGVASSSYTSYTLARSINDRGQVTGFYSDASGRWHGFIATPMTPFSTFNVTRLVIDQNRGALFLWSNFALGGDSNGINPAQEDIAILYRL